MVQTTLRREAKKCKNGGQYQPTVTILKARTAEKILEKLKLHRLLTDGVEKKLHIVDISIIYDFPSNASVNMH